MKLAIYEVGFISQIVKGQNLELQAFSQWQYLGKNLLSSVFIALLDYFIANNKTQSMEQLAKPKSSYQNAQNSKISQLIYSLRMGKINPKEFFAHLKNIDSSNEKGEQLLEEFCQLQGLKRAANNLRSIIESIANFFSIAVNLIKQYQFGNNTKYRVSILQQVDGYYLIKQSSPIIQYINQRQQICNICSKRCDDYCITPNCLHINCNKCLSDKIKKANSQYILCKCMEKILINDIQQNLINNFNTQKPQLEQSFNLSKSQQFSNDNQISYPTNSVIVSNNKQPQYNNLIDSKQQYICNFCKQPTTNQFFINNSCSHKFCLDCFKQKIISKDQKCPIKDCYKYIENSLYQQRIQLEQDIQKNKKVIQLQNSQLIKCSNCKNEYNRNSLYKDRCIHLVCFPCIQLQVQKSIQKQSKYQYVTCPSCNNIYGSEFEKYYDQQQLRLLEEKIIYDEQFQKEDQEKEHKEREQQKALQQKQQEQQKQLLQSPSSQKNIEKQSQEFNDRQKQQSQIYAYNDKQNNSTSNKNVKEEIQKEELKQFEQGECSMCFTKFSEFNLRQRIDCEYHTIGVCCMINCDRCPQCEQVNTKSIRIKPKLILQTFILKVESIIQSNIYNSSIKQYNYGDADDYSRLNSRANVNQSKPQQRNSTMDTNLIRNQPQQHNMVSMYRAGFRR